MTLPLDSFRSVLGYNPWHFWGWDTSSVRAMTSKCNGMVMEYAWQDADITGRSDMRREIERAEQRLKNVLGYRPGPEFVEATIRYPAYFDARMTRYADVDARGRRLAVQVGEGLIRAVGKMTRQAVLIAAPVVYSDTDGDGLNDTFTVTVAGGAALIPNLSEVAIYVPTGDRTGDVTISERWRIAPIQARVSGLNLIITGRAWVMAKPILYEGLLASGGIDPLVPANYLSTVSLYRLYADPNGYTVDDSQAVLIWESLPLPGCAIACCGGVPALSSDPDAVGYAVARSGIRDARLGYLTPGESVISSNGAWIETGWSNCRQPDRVIIRFQAGAQLDALDGPSPSIPSALPGNNIRFDEVITRLAIAQMTRRLCACEDANQEWYRWQFDLSRAAGANDEQYRISEADLGNPFGTRAGEVYAWRQVRLSALPSVAIA